MNTILEKDKMNTILKKCKDEYYSWKNTKMNIILEKDKMNTILKKYKDEYYS